MPPLVELRKISRIKLLKLAMFLPIAACTPPPPVEAPRPPTKIIADAAPIQEPVPTLPPPPMANTTATSVSTPTSFITIEPTIVRRAIDIPEVAARQTPPIAQPSETANLSQVSSRQDVPNKPLEERASVTVKATEKPATKTPPKSTPIPEEIKGLPFSIIWEKKNEVPFMSPKFSLLADEKHVYGSSENRRLAAFNVATGKQVWVWQQDTSVAYTYQHDNFDPDLLFATHGDNLWVLDKSNGQPKFPFIPYQKRFQTSQESIQPAFFDGVIAFNHLFKAGRSTTVVDKYTGKTLWYTDGIVWHTHSNLAVVNTTTKVKDFNIVDIETGERKNKLLENENGDSIESYYEGGFAYLVISDGSKFKIVALDLEGKKVSWSIDDSKIKGHKTFVNKDPQDDNLYVKSKPDSQSGEVLTAISKKTGKPAWEINLGKRVKVSPTVLAVTQGLVVLKDAENFTTLLVDIKGLKSEIGKTQINSIVGVQDRRVLVGIGGYDPHTYGVYGIDLSSRKEIWRKAGQQHNSLYSVLTGGKVFLGKAASDKLQVFDAANGNPFEPFKTGEVTKIVSPRPGLVLAHSGTIYAIKA